MSDVTSYAGKTAPPTAAGELRRLPVRLIPGMPVLLVVLLAALLLLPGCGKETVPDILLITIDTLRADRVGCYGYAAAETPTLDRLAAEGTRYEQCSAAVPITLPSHATILTGQLPARLGVRNNGTYRLGDEAPTLAEQLAAHGYLTAAFVAAFPVDARFGLARGFSVYDDECPGSGSGQGSGVFEYSERPGSEVVHAALEWLEGQSRQQPVFLWIHLFEPHHPYEPPAPWSDSLADRPYDGEVAAVDAAIAELLTGLDEIRSHPRLTLVTSDHGEGLGEHGELTHAFFLYETTLRVPLIVHQPGPVPAGRVVSEPVGLVDVAPTVLALAGLDPSPLVCDGIALDPAAEPPCRDLLAETLAGYESCGWSPSFALRRGASKVIRSARSRAFDLASDPDEMQELLSGAELPGWVPALLTDIDEQIVGLDSLEQAMSTGSASTRELTVEEQRRLNALGYVDGAPSTTAQRPGGWLPLLEELPDPTERQAAYDSVTRAQQHILQEDYEAAIALLEPLLAENPANSWARSFLAGSLRELGRTEEAIAQFTRLTEQQPRRLEPRWSLARLLRQTDRFDEAIAQYLQAVRFAPGNLPLLQEAISLLAGQGRYNRVLGLLDEVSVWPDWSETDHAALLVWYVKMHLARGQGASGRPYVDRARALADREELIILDVRVTLAEENWSRAEKLLATSGLPATRPDILVLQARFMAGGGDPESGIIVLRRCIAAQENYAVAHASLASLLAAAPDSPVNQTEAVRHATRAVELQGSSPGFHLTYLTALEAAGRTADAVAHARRIVARFPDHPELQAGIQRLLQN
ncbi:MAG: sulfatase-like hydrolase/transferase [bacterium]